MKEAKELLNKFFEIIITKQIELDNELEHFEENYKHGYQDDGSNPFEELTDSLGALDEIVGHKKELEELLDKVVF